MVPAPSEKKLLSEFGEVGIFADVIQCSGVVDVSVRKTLSGPFNKQRAQAQFQRFPHNTQQREKDV